MRQLKKVSGPLKQVSGTFRRYRVTVMWSRLQGFRHLFQHTPMAGARSHCEVGLSRHCTTDFRSVGGECRRRTGCPSFPKQYRTTQPWRTVEQCSDATFGALRQFCRGGYSRQHALALLSGGRGGTNHRGGMCHRHGDCHHRDAESHRNSTTNAGEKSPDARSIQAVSSCRLIQRTSVISLLSGTMSPSHVAR